MWVDKLLEKEQSAMKIESAFEGYNAFLELFASRSEEMDADFVRIEFRKVKRTFIDHVKDRFTSVGKILAKSAEKEVEEL